MKTQEQLSEDIKRLPCKLFLIRLSCFRSSSGINNIIVQTSSLGLPALTDWDNAKANSIKKSIILEQKECN